MTSQRNWWRRVVAASRVEDLLALAATLGALVLLAVTDSYRRFQLGLLDIFFILLPLLLLLFKIVITEFVAFSRSEIATTDPESYLWDFLGKLVQLFRDWFPFFLLSAFYYSLFTNFILRVNPHTADAHLAAIDAWLLGDQAAILLQPWVRPWLTDLLNTIYVSYLLYFPGIAFYLYVTGRHHTFRRVMLGLLLLMGMGVVSYILVPAIGPGKFFYDRFTVPLWERPSDPMAMLIDRYRVVHDCFPSLHVGIPLLLCLYAWEARARGIATLATCYVLLMAAATIYLRYHYVIDVLAVPPYVVAAWRLADMLLAKWESWQAWLIGPPPDPADRLGPASSQTG